MAFQQNAFQHNAFQIGLGPPAAPPQRLYLWRILAVAALGILATEDYGQPNQQGLHAFRGSSAHGTVPVAYNQLVLVEAQQDARRTDHNARLFFGRSTAVAATPGAPWYLWAPPERQLEPEEDARRSDHDALHQYRTGYQTVGQNYRLIRPQPAVADQTIPEDAQRVNHALLHRYRTGYQTVGQPFQIWPGPQKRIDAEEYAIPKPVDLTAFRNTAPSVATPGAPWYLWVPPIQRIDPEDDARRSDQTLLHRYRVGYQTVGQSFQVWPGPQKRIESEEYTIPPPSNFALRRITQATAVPGQPWYLWPNAKSDQIPEDDARRSDHTRLHQYRVGYQTVGQSWQYWIKPQQRVDAEEYTVPGPANLYPFRQIILTAAPGQPWWMWPSAKADQTIEPNPVVTDHANALYPFRPHDAITTVVVPPVDTSGGWAIPYKRVKRKPLVENLPTSDEYQQLEASIPAEAVERVKTVAKRDYAELMAVSRSQQRERLKAEMKAKDEQYKAIYAQFLVLELARLREEEAMFMLAMASLLLDV